MDKIKTTDCYVPVHDENQKKHALIVASNNTDTIWLEKKEGVIVLTEQEFEKEVSDRVQAALSLLNVKPQSLPNI